jgi:hypothetical protein
MFNITRGGTGKAGRTRVGQSGLPDLRTMLLNPGKPGLRRGRGGGCRSMLAGVMVTTGLSAAPLSLKGG